MAGYFTFVFIVLHWILPLQRIHSYAKELPHSHSYSDSSLTLGAEGFDEKVFLGSENEVAKLKGMTQKQTMEQVDAVAKKIDRDQDGFISKGELEGWIMNSLRQLKREETNQRFSDYDYDNDGKIGKEDHLYSVHGFLPTPEQFTAEGEVVDSPRSMEDQRYWLKLFGLADVDRNGELTREEFQAYYRPEGYEHTRIVNEQRVLNDHDTDKDGRLSLKEILDDYPADWHETLTKRFKEEFDKDGNGFLQGMEVVEWAIPGDADLAVQETSHLFYEADDDKDGRLTREEIGKHLEIFVGSQFANFSPRIRDEL